MLFILASLLLKLMQMMNLDYFPLYCISLKAIFPANNHTENMLILLNHYLIARYLIWGGVFYFVWRFLLCCLVFFPLPSFFQYARADELDKMRKEYMDGVAHLTAFIDGSNKKFSSPVEVSFHDVKTFVQDLEVSVLLSFLSSSFKRNSQLFNSDSMKVF